jgi:hypothetical protein
MTVPSAKLTDAFKAAATLNLAHTDVHEALMLEQLKAAIGLGSTDTLEGLTILEADLRRETNLAVDRAMTQLNAERNQ